MSRFEEDLIASGYLRQGEESLWRRVEQKGKIHGTFFQETRFEVSIAFDRGETWLQVSISRTEGEPGKLPYLSRYDLSISERRVFVYSEDVWNEVAEMEMRLLESLSRASRSRSGTGLDV